MWTDGHETSSRYSQFWNAPNHIHSFSSYLTENTLVLHTEENGSVLFSDVVAVCANKRRKH